MNKETVYKDLLSYKIPDDDLKTIAEVFIFVQNQGNNLLLSDLIKIYFKKINITRFFNLIKNAAQNSVQIPFDLLITSSLNKDDLLNLTEGFIFAKTADFESTFSELEEYGKMKISLSLLIKAASQLKNAESDIELSDFRNSTVFLYKPELYIKILLKIKKLQPLVSLKEIIALKYSVGEIEEIIDLSRRTQNLKNKLEIHELISMKKRGIKIREIVAALDLSEKLQSNLTVGQIIAFEASGFSPLQLLKSTFEPENIELNPLTAVVKAGYEIIFKIELKITTNLNNFPYGLNRRQVIDSASFQLFKIITDYKDYIEIKTDKNLIEKKILNELTLNESSYKIVSFTIKDLIIGRNLKAEQLKTEQEILEREAAVAEARLRTEKAKAELAELLRQYKNTNSENQTSEQKPEEKEEVHEETKT
jgi:uncharacterized protein YqfA (UPF0365 family)